MFRVRHNVPDVYIQESRDFQLISALYDLTFQSTRFSIDSLKFCSDTKKCNSSLLPLIGTKVGLFETLDVPDDVYRMVLSAFPYIIRHKGTLQSIMLLLNLYERVTNQQIILKTEELDTDNRIVIEFSVYARYKDLFYTILEYIRPSGLLIDFILSSNLDITADADVVYLKDNVTVSNPSKISANNMILTANSISRESNIGFSIIDMNGDINDVTN